MVGGEGRGGHSVALKFHFPVNTAFLGILGACTPEGREILPPGAVQATGAHLGGGDCAL